MRSIFLRARLFATLTLLLLFAASCSPQTAETIVEPERAEVVESNRGLVVAAHPEATRAGQEILQQGGNAVDASVATGFALAVVYPRAGNIGGGGFMIIRSDDGEVTSIGYREKAPMAATKDMYLDESGEFIEGLSWTGHLASGVPGAVAGMLKALDTYGTMSRAEVMAPAIRLAEEGYPLPASQARRFTRFRDTFSEFPSTEKYFTKADSTQQYQTGELFVQSDLADVLKRIRDEGRAGFYQGETADLIVAEMERGGGLITHEDLRAYDAVERTPVKADYRGYGVYGMAPPSSGGVAVAQLLNAVEPYDVRALGHNTAPMVHLMGEAMRRVYADRAKWLGDADFVDVPIAELTSERYMRRRMADFNPYHADTSADITHGQPVAYESTETTHYSVVDGDGNAVSVTTTVNGSFGSKVVVDGAGFFLNNEMDDFSAKPGVPNAYGLLGSEANSIAPEKRMLSSMSPTIVEDPQGRLFLVTGTPGGARIITMVYQILMNVIDHNMDIGEAIYGRRIHHQWKPDELEYEIGSLSPEERAVLRSRGWTLERDNGWGIANGIRARYMDGTVRYYGAADPRSDGLALGL